MRLADDRTSSATVLFDEAERVLRAARGNGRDAAREAAVSVCAAQPSMGALWNLAALALVDDSAGFDRFVARARRAPAVVSLNLRLLLGGDVRRVVTCSRSAMVEACINALGRPVVCAESRPRLEGRDLAAAVAARGVPVTVVADAAIAGDLRPGDAVLVGADAVGPDWFINKVGSRLLCTAAELAGVSGYAVTGREKCVSGRIAALLRLRDDDPDTLWSDPPEGVRVFNPLFERVPLDCAAGVMTDAGLLAGDMVRQACESAIPDRAVKALVDLLTEA